MNNAYLLMHDSRMHAYGVKCKSHRFTGTYFYSKSVEQGISIAGARIVELISAEKNTTFTTWLKDINTAKLTPNDLKS